jgi:hypothetical protein
MGRLPRSGTASIEGQIRSVADISQAEAEAAAASREKASAR